MSTFLKILGGLLILAGIIWAGVIISGVAGHKEGFTTLAGLIPALIFHAAALLGGISLVGLGFKVKRQPAVN